MTTLPRWPRAGGVLVLVLVALLIACTDDGGDDATVPTNDVPVSPIERVDLQLLLDGWSLRALEPDAYRPRPENDCRRANGVHDELQRQRILSAIRDEGGATVTVDLVEYASEAAASDAYDRLVMVDVVCVLPTLGGRGDLRRTVAPDSWLRIGGEPSYGWQASVPQDVGAVYPTLYGVVALAEGAVVAVVSSVRTDGVIDDPVPLAEGLRAQLAG